MAFNDDFQKMRKQRLRDRFFDSDFDKEREMFFNTSPSFQSFFNRRGDGFTRPARPQSQPSFGKMFEEDSDELPPNAKVRYIPVQHEWNSDSRKSNNPSEEQAEYSPRSSMHSSPHTSPQCGTPPVQPAFPERSELPPSCSQQVPNKPREYIIPIKILDNDVSMDTGTAHNSPRYPQRGHSLNDDSRRLNANRFNLDEGRPHSTPNSPNIWPRSRHTSGPIYSQVYEPRKMEATMERDEPKRSDFKEYIIPVRMVPEQNRNSNERADMPSTSADEEENPHTPVNVQKLKAQFESPTPKPQFRPQWPTASESQSRQPHWMPEMTRPEPQQEKVYHIPVIRETSPMTERQRSNSPQRGQSPHRGSSPQSGPSFQKGPSPQRQPSPPSVPPETHLPKPPEFNRAPTPEPVKQMTPMEKIYAIEADVRELENLVRNFEGKKTDKHYLFLDEMFTRQLIKLDVIETDGVPEIRQARKAIVQLINELVTELENKALQNTNDSQANQQPIKDTQVSQLANVPLDVSVQSSMDDSAFFSSGPVHNSENNLHVSHVEINPSAPHVTQVEITSNPGQHVTQVNVNKENDNVEKHISRVEINMDCENHTNNNSKLEQGKNTPGSGNCNPVSVESSHMLSTSV